MADLLLDNNDIVVRLSTLEALAVWRRELRVPARDLRMVQVEDEPLKALAHWRMPGLWWPGAFVLGTGRQCGRREFAAARARQPAVVLDLEGQAWDRLVVSCPDAVNVAAELATVALALRPRHGAGRPPGAASASAAP